MESEEMGVGEGQGSHGYEEEQSRGGEKEEEEFGGRRKRLLNPPDEGNRLVVGILWL